MCIRDRAEAVRQDALGIGFNNIGFAYDLTTGNQLDGLRVVPLDLNGDGQISVDEDFYATIDDIAGAIAAKVYPFPPARELYLVTKGEPTPVIQDLYRWILDVYKRQGLYLVKRIAEAHGGQVGVDDRPGGGAVFWMDLPLVSEEKSA